MATTKAVPITPPPDRQPPAHAEQASRYPEPGNRNSNGVISPQQPGTSNQSLPNFSFPLQQQYDCINGALTQFLRNGHPNGSCLRSALPSCERH